MNDDSESPIEQYDRLADLFMHITGMMAPGKDVAAGGYGGGTREQRCTAWDVFIPLYHALNQLPRFDLLHPPLGGTRQLVKQQLGDLVNFNDVLRLLMHQKTGAMLAERAKGAS